MYTRTGLLLAYFIATFNCHAQILPAEGSKLNYNQVMFDHEKVSGASFYLVQVTSDAPGSSFSHLLVEQKDSSTATMIGHLPFGKKYQWRYAGIKEGQNPVWNGPYHFEISQDSFINKNIVSQIVTQNDTGANAGGLIVNDCTHTAVDRAGNLVWYQTKVNWFFSLTQYTKTVEGKQTTTKNMAITPGIFDLRLTPYGTVTCLADSVAAEYDLNGNVLWKAPNDGTVSGLGNEGYNHDFKRLANGHYMVLGDQLWRKLPPEYVDTIAGKKKFADRQFFNGTEYSKVEFGTVIEYDKHGNIVWSWNSADYLSNDPLGPKIRNQKIEYQLKTHINAFSTDKKNEFVYVGFRDISRIVKIEKRTGNVVNSWGLKLPQGGASHAVYIHQQHDANILDNGNIAVFNSNDYPGNDSIPSVVIISQQPADSNKIIWRFDCNFDSLDRRAARNGGNVDQLKNGNYLVCMGNSDGIFEVTPDKKVVWQSQIRLHSTDGINYYHRLYRAHYISSLYPCYFTFQTNVDTASKKAPDFSIRLFNKGSENDSYSVKIALASGQLLNQFITDTISPNRSVTLNIAPGKHLRKDDKIEVSISSQTNPGFERKSWVVVQ